MRVQGDWLTRGSTQTVCRMLTNAGYQALLVGGCVRNALLGAPVADIDIATDAVPDQVVELAQAAGLQAIPTGIDYGTITVVSDTIAHEITTFRKDVETDGRRAVVAYSKDVTEDAKRRDFTMNALYAKANGTLVDPLGGLADLRARRFRFIDDADARIREDYLRILRYFRFHAWYGDTEAGLDPDALGAIADNVDGLSRLSKERVSSETLKLLAAPDPAPSVAAMRQTGALTQILPGAEDRWLSILVHLEGSTCMSPDPIRRLAVLGGDQAEAALKLSKKDAKHLAQLREEIGSTTGAAELAYRHDAETAQTILLLRHALFETPMLAGWDRDIALGSSALFPLEARDLMDRFQGKALGDALRRCEDSWIASGFQMTKDQLLETL